MWKITALALILAAAAWLAPAPARCLGCIWTGQCFSDSICGEGCICVKRDSIDTAGFCARR